MARHLPIQMMAAVIRVAPATLAQWTRIGLVRCIRPGVYDPDQVRDDLAHPRIDPPDPDDPIWQQVQAFAREAAASTEPARRADRTADNNQETP